MVVYVMPGYSNFGGLLPKLGKHKTGKSCLYLGSLAKIDMAVLEKIVAGGYWAMKEKYAAR